MTKKVLADLVNKKMIEHKLSLRNAAKQVGVSHTTVSRLLDGVQLDLQTMTKFCDWCGVSPAQVLDVTYNGDISEEDSIVKHLSIIVTSNPRLKRVFSTLLGLDGNKRLPDETISEILDFIAFKISK